MKFDLYAQNSQYPGYCLLCHKDQMERDKGIEPSYPAWKAGVLADVLIPQMGTKVPGKGNKKERKVYHFLWSRRPDLNRYGYFTEGF